MPLAQGAKLGPYEILSPLGAGGMGEVYRARDTGLRREVAVKLLHPGALSNPDRLRRIHQEAQAAAALNHPNILAIHYVGEHEGAPYIISELLEGESLRDRLREGILLARETLDYAEQIANGLAAAHEKGIVHRDLKPENIFLTKDGRAKILDFGLAKLICPDETSGDSPGPTQTLGSAPGVALGTVAYLSPEQVRGMPVDWRSDIFSFGLILYEMLSGKNAFLRGTSADTMTAILKEDPPELTVSSSGVSSTLDRIVRRCLEKEPLERFQSVRDVAFALQAATGSSVLTPSPVAETPRRSWAARRGVLVFALVAAVCLVLEVAAYRLALRGSWSEFVLTRFTIAVFLHLVGMVGLFIGYGLEWVASSLLRRSTNAEQVRAWLRIYRLSLPISGPGLLLLILSGVYFASITESMKQGWLLSSLLAIVFALGIGFVFILPRVRKLRAVLPEGNTPLSEAGRASVQDPVILTLIRVRFLLALGILYLMIAKPDLATSLFVLLGAIVVGLISAATAWTARPA